MSGNIIDRLAQDKVARVTGGFYLASILASLLADRLGRIGLTATSSPFAHRVSGERDLRRTAPAGGHGSVRREFRLDEGGQRP